MRTVITQEEKLTNIKSDKTGIADELCNDKDQVEKECSCKVFDFMAYSISKKAAPNKDFTEDLRRGLVLKVHEFRRKIEADLNSAHADLDQQTREKMIRVMLDLTGECTDFILFEEVSTPCLLDAYSKFKKQLERQVKGFISLAQNSKVPV